MEHKDLVTAYKDIAIPAKQKQELPGLDVKLTPHLEYTKLEYWDEEGKPYLEEYKGVGKLKGKTAIITGGDSGIGRAVAIMFGREGCRGVTITHLPQEKPDAEDAKKLVQDSGAEVLLVEVDLEKQEDCRAVVDQHIRKFGTLSILVNNASKQIFCSRLEDIDIKTVESTFRSNIIQMIAVTKFALPHMKRGGSIINTSSVVACAGSGALIDYSATKGAIVSFTRSLAKQLMERGIRVNAVAPGLVITALQAASRPAEQMEGLGLGQPLRGRGGQPAELGPAYVFLASSDSNLMTGQVLHINNGEHIGSS